MVGLSPSHQLQSSSHDDSVSSSVAHGAEVSSSRAPHYDGASNLESEHEGAGEANCGKRRGMPLKYALAICVVLFCCYVSCRCCWGSEETEFPDVLLAVV
jgi:hypothetical protein